MLSNAYLLAKFRFDTAENERNFAEILPKIGNYPKGPLWKPCRSSVMIRWAERMRRICAYPARQHRRDMPRPPKLEIQLMSARSRRNQNDIKREELVILHVQPLRNYLDTRLEICNVSYSLCTFRTIFGSVLHLSARCTIITSILLAL